MTKPFFYQLAGVRAIKRMNFRSLVAYDPGLGKSLMALMAANEIPDSRPVVVVCPSYLKWNWQNEARKHFHRRAEVLSGYRPKGGKPIKIPDLIIVNYDILHDKTTRHGKLRGWAKWLKDKAKPKFVVIDEPTYIKSRVSARTRGVRSLCKDVPHVLALGGTGGMENCPAELFPILNILRPDEFPSWLPFAFRFCGAKKNPYGGWDFKGASKTKELRKLLLETCMIRKRKEEVLHQLPKKRRIVTLLDIERRGEYDQAVGNFSDWLRKNHGAGDERSEGLVKIGHLLRLTAELKMASVCEWLDRWLEASDGKILLFAVHRKVVKFLHERHAKESVAVTGEVTGRKRQNAFDRFLRDKRTRILIGNVQAAGYGWSAEGVSVTAFVEFAWTPGLHLQAEDRTHGLGRGVKGVRSESHWLVAKGTVEETTCRAIQRKQKYLSNVLDGSFKEGDIDVWDSICKSLLIKK